MRFYAEDGLSLQPENLCLKKKVEQLSTQKIA